MSVYHCSVKSISRGAGQSLIAAAAYRHTDTMTDKRTGQTYDYTRKQGLVSSSMHFPNLVRGNGASLADVLNAAEAAERRKDARLGREVLLALPAELTPDQRKQLAEDMAQYLANAYGVFTSLAIHEPSRKGDDRNHHAHILMTSRKLYAQGFGEKARELDDRTQGPIEVQRIRKEWERMANNALRLAGHETRIDCRSLKDQGIHRAPTVHLGVKATAMERKGQPTRLGDINRAAQAFNREAAALRTMIKDVKQLKTQVRSIPTPAMPTPSASARDAAARIRQDTPRPTPPAAQVQPKHDIEPQPTLRGAELLPRIKELQEALTAAEEKKARFSLNWHDAKAKTASIQREIDEHNRAAKEGGVLKKIFGAGKVNAAADALLEKYEAAQRLEAAAAAACKVGTALVQDAHAKFEQTIKDYEASPHGKAAAEKKEQERLEKLRQEREKREQKKIERALAPRSRSRMR